MLIPLSCRVLADEALRFDDGDPVRAASGITRFGEGWLVVSDDATHAARWTAEGVTRLRVLPAVDGRDEFDEASGTKHLKPDLEAACRVLVDGEPAVLLLGSGSLPARMRAILVDEATASPVAAALDPLYGAVAAVLGIELAHLNLEGACVAGDVLRWFQRGNTHLRVPSGSVDIPVGQMVAALRGLAAPEDVAVRAPWSYDLGDLAITDVIALPDGRLIASAAAEHTTNAVDDGAVTDAALVLLDGGDVRALGRLPEEPDGPSKIEGLALSRLDGTTAHLWAVVDADDHEVPSRALRLEVDLPPALRRTACGGPKTR